MVVGIMLWHNRLFDGAFGGRLGNRNLGCVKGSGHSLSRQALQQMPRTIVIPAFSSRDEIWKLSFFISIMYFIPGMPDQS